MPRTWPELRIESEHMMNDPPDRSRQPRGSDGKRYKILKYLVRPDRELCVVLLRCFVSIHPIAGAPNPETREE